MTEEIEALGVESTNARNLSNVSAFEKYTDTDVLPAGCIASCFTGGVSTGSATDFLGNGLGVSVGSGGIGLGMP